MQFCSYQERAVSEVRKKLLPFCEGVDIDEVIQLLQKENFINEERFTASFVRGKILGKKWGKLKVIAALKAKSIPEKLIFKCLKAEIPEAEYRENLKKLIEGHSSGLSASRENQAKLYRYLSSKGYENELIWESIGGDT